MRFHAEGVDQLGPVRPSDTELSGSNFTSFRLIICQFGGHGVIVTVERKGWHKFADRSAEDMTRHNIAYTKFCIKLAFNRWDI